LISGPFAVTPAFATDAQDAYFESCKTEYISRNMGNDDAATAYCYEKAYGSETSGGGSGEVRYVGEGNQCYGSQVQCNPNLRPQ
jgi:hypothetical protein